MPKYGYPMDTSYPCAIDIHIRFRWFDPVNLDPIFLNLFPSLCLKMVETSLIFWRESCYLLYFLKSSCFWMRNYYFGSIPNNVNFVFFIDFGVKIVTFWAILTLCFLYFYRWRREKAANARIGQRRPQGNGQKLNKASRFPFLNAFSYFSSLRHFFLTLECV